jgi:hypothetical protein
MRFNINHCVRVKLTQMGRNQHRAWHQQEYKGLCEYHPPREDAEGWSEWQLWVLMKELGQFLSWGPDQPIETEIEIIEPRHP